jgi:hypothetical protein
MVPGFPYAVEDITCNVIDEDCDGDVDEDFRSTDSCGIGACEQQNFCENGEIICIPGDSFIRE